MSERYERADDRDGPETPWKAAPSSPAPEAQRTADRRCRRCHGAGFEPNCIPSAACRSCGGSGTIGAEPVPPLPAPSSEAYLTDLRERIERKNASLDSTTRITEADLSLIDLNPCSASPPSDLPDVRKRA